MELAGLGSIQPYASQCYMSMKILDRQKLEETVCECCRVVKDEFHRLLG
jgi:hypothetical protein